MLMLMLTAGRESREPNDRWWRIISHSISVCLRGIKLCLKEVKLYTDCVKWMGYMSPISLVWSWLTFDLGWDVFFVPPPRQTLAGQVFSVNRGLLPPLVTDMNYLTPACCSKQCFMLNVNELNNQRTVQLHQGSLTHAYYRCHSNRSTWIRLDLFNEHSTNVIVCHHCLL